VDDAQCNDMIACTYDSCDKSVGRCTNVPDDAQCDDHVYCDGKEKCVPGQGCEPGPVVSCDNGNSCQIATCVEATKSCAYVPRDVDQDGDPDAHCVPKHDCDDLNPNVSSRHAEVCNNGIDDNCNGLIDEHPCVLPQGTSCATAIAMMGAGTLSISTVGANRSFATSCGVSNPQGAENVVVAIRVPPGPNVDLEVWATAQGTEVAVAVDGTCGQAGSELACASVPGASSARARARNVPPGTYFAVVTTQSTADVQLEVALLAPSPKATNVDCATAAPIVPGMPTPVSIIDAPTTLPSACTASMAGASGPAGGALTGALTYAFTLTAPQDVRVWATTVRGEGAPVLGLRGAPCTSAASEISCRAAGEPPIFARSLPPGRYVVTIAATAPIDASLEVDLAPPTAAPPDQSCAAPPAIAANQRAMFDLANHADVIKDGCNPGGPQAVFDLPISAASDVLLVSRVAQTEQGGVALDSATCTARTPALCDVESPAPTPPARVGVRNLPAGDYRVVVSDQLGLTGTVDALVRATVPPTLIPPRGADTCAQAVDASHGGFFTGDTSTATADYSNGCDAPGGPPGGAADQVLALDLTQAQRVVLDMEGSAYETLLDVRLGPDCPGTPVMSGCYVGFGVQRSFLDLELTPGRYWIIVDGYDLAKGAWNLDVRVLPP
jgi:hypothetical protein